MVLAYRIEDAGDAERLGRLIHSYQLIEGTVLNVGEGSGRLYLNFAGDWHSDFTSALRGKTPPPLPPPGSIRRRSPASACACAAGSPGGTAPVEATHPDQIELLAEAGGAANDKSPPQRRAIAL